MWYFLLERQMVRQRQKILGYWFTPKWSYWQELLQTETRGLELLYFYHVVTETQVPGLSPGTLLGVLARGLDHKNNSQAANQHLYRMLAFRVVF